MFLLYYSEGRNICGEVLPCMLHQRLVHYNMQWCAGSPHLVMNMAKNIVHMNSLSGASTIEQTRYGAFSVL